MMKKMIASVGLAAAATAGALFLSGSPASAETTHVSTPAGVVHIQTSAVAYKTVAHKTYTKHKAHKPRRGHRYDSYYWRHHHNTKHHNTKHYNNGHDDKGYHGAGYHYSGRVVLKSSNNNTNIAISS